MYVYINLHMNFLPLLYWLADSLLFKKLVSTTATLGAVCVCVVVLLVKGKNREMKY